MIGGILRRLARRAAVLGALSALAAAGARPARAQESACDPGDVEVVRLAFTGNHAFSHATLAQAVATTPSSWLRRHTGLLGTRRCIEPGEVRLDVVRLGIFYRKRGYPDVRVDTLVRTLQPGAELVTFVITEGEPLRLRALTITGLDSVPERAAIVRGLPVVLGAPFDQIRVDSARDEIVARLRNGGYPFADALRSSTTSRESRSATVTYDVQPGPRTRVTRVEVQIEPRKRGEPTQISAAVVRRLIGVHKGDLVRTGELGAAQRALYRTDAYEHVDIRLVNDSSGRVGADSGVAVRVSLLEQRMRSAELGAGLGTLDCVRFSGSFTDRNIGHQANRLDLTAQVSKIGVGQPLDVVPSFCRSLSGGNGANADPFSDKLNYRLGATFTPRALLGLRTLPSLTLFTEVRSEYRAYLRRTPLGATAALDVTPTPRFPSTLAYAYTIGRTEAAPAFFCAVFSRCDESSRAELEQNRRLGTVSLSAQRVRTNAIEDITSAPSRGFAVSGELRHASRLTGSDRTLKFNKATIDGAWYLPVVGGGVVAARLRAGSVFGTSLTGVASTVPTEERLYAGGPTTVRGYGQNELGPVVYTVTARDTLLVPGDSSTRSLFVPKAFGPDRIIPVGGNALLVANLEYRSRRFADNLLQYVLFADAGQVWNHGKDSLNLDFNQFKVTPGAGVRIYTTLGITFRVDVGYNGSRREKGVVYYSDPIGAGGTGGQVYCLEPGNFVLRSQAQANAKNGACGLYAPETRHTLLSRLTPSFSIGQAF